MQTPGAARVQLRQIKPKPHTVERMEALPAIARFVAAAPDAEWIWLSDGVEIEHGAEFVAALRQDDRGQTAHHRRGRHAAGALALAAADNAAGGLSVKVLRAARAVE